MSMRTRSEWMWLAAFACLLSACYGYRNEKLPMGFNISAHYLETRRPLQPSSQWCQDSLHIHGRWELNPNATKAFPCCGWDRHDYNWNNTLCGRAPLGDHFFNGDYTGQYFVQFGGHACTCDQSGNARTSVHRVQRYRWVPSYCDLTPFDAEYFCALLGPRRMLFIGDSTFVQTAGTIMNLLKASPSSAAHCAGNVYAAHVNHLWDFSSDWKMDWIDNIIMHDPQIVIFGMGAHIYSTDQFRSDWDKAMNMFHRFLKEQRPKLIDTGQMSPYPIQMVFKTQNPGHLNCDDYTEPVDTKPFIENDRRDIYRWGLFDLYDQLGRSLAYRANYSVLDVSPLYLRTDAHPGGIDCLHFCAPGPLDFIGNILLTMMHTGEI